MPTASRFDRSTMAKCSGSALAASLGLQAVSFLAFASLPRVPALTTGLIGGNHNMAVVWANLDSKIYHFSGNKNYGNTKSGAYMCEKETAAAGVRAAKNEKHP